MSMLTRLANRVRPQRLERDLHDEVAFHIQMRANENATAGLPADEAATKAHGQFGDVDAVISAMRRERVASPAQVLTVTACIVALVLWLAPVRTPHLKMPAPPAAPSLRDPDRLSGSPPPPRPGPGPTWEQYVKQTKAFEALEKGPGRYSPGTVIDDITHPR